MHKLSLNYKIAMGLFVILGLWAVNYKLVNSSLENDFFGLFFSVLLFVFGSRHTQFKVNYFLVFFILGCQFVSYRLHTQSLHFLSIILFLCLLFYSFTQRFSYIALICLLLFSTLFNKFSEHLTTEIKQNLCMLVYLSLKNFIAIDKIEGVNFYSNHAKITIDTACMGLAMFKTGLLTAAVLLTLEEKKQAKYFSIYAIIGFSVVVMLLNILSNYFRIITLILLQCTQENLLHHTVGLLCFLVYQVAPMLFIIRFFTPKNLITKTEKSPSNPILILLPLIIIIVTSFEVQKTQNNDILQNLNPKYKLSKGVWVTNEVFKIETPKELIYIKTPSHKPLICWTGSGYTITHSEEITINKEKIWSVEMEKNNLKYQSYWWYECGQKKYTSFLEIMVMKLIYNQPIRLVNVTRGKG